MSAVETLTDDERAVICGAPSLVTLGDSGAKALRIIDAHVADRAALVAQLEAADHAAIETIRGLMSELESAIREQVELKAERDGARAENKLALDDAIDMRLSAEAEVTRLTKALAAAEQAMREANRVSENAIRARDTAEARVRELEAAERECDEATKRSVQHRIALADANTLLREAPHAPGVRGRAWQSRVDAHLSAQPDAAPTHAALVAQLAERTHERAALVAQLEAAEREGLAAVGLAEKRRDRAKAAEARVEALETLLAASEARAEQWKADAESYRADATVAQDRLEALQERVNSVIEQAPDGFQVDAASLKRVLRG